MSGTKVSGSTGKFTADCSNPQQAFGGILAAWLRTTFGRGASKKIQQSLNVSRYVADQALAGHVSIDTLITMISVWKEPFVTGVIREIASFSSLDNDIVSKFRNLEIQIANLKLKIEDLYFEMEKSGVYNFSEYNTDYKELRESFSSFFKIIDRISDKINPIFHNKSNSVIDDLRVFSGKVLMHEEFNVDKACEIHLNLLKIYNESDGYFNESFSNYLMTLKDCDAVSIYDEDAKVRRIGSGTIFWTEEQRRTVIGKSVCEIPAPKDYTGLVYNAITSSVKQSTPKLHLIGFRAGDKEAFYDRMIFSFPRSSLVVAVPLHSRRFLNK